MRFKLNNWINEACYIHNIDDGLKWVIRQDQIELDNFVVFIEAKDGTILHESDGIFSTLKQAKEYINNFYNKSAIKE